MKKLLLICVIVLSLCGCKDKQTEEPQVPYLTLVTYAGTDETLQVSTFTYQAIDDSPLITLTANWIPTSELTPGERIYINYYADAYGVSGPIELRQVVSVIGWQPTVKEAPFPLGNVDITPVTVWRSGPYLNARIDAMITRDPVTVEFALDKSTADKPMPIFYLYVNQQDLSQIEAYWRTATLSYDISSVWSKPDCTGVQVVYRGLYGAESTFEIKKSL